MRLYPMKKKVLAILLIFLAVQNIQSQPEPPAFAKQLANARDDTSMAKIYLAMAGYYLHKNSDSTILFSTKCLALYLGGKDEKVVVKAHIHKGIGLENKGKYAEALQSYVEALRISERLNFKGLTAHVYSDIGILYTHTEDYSHALDYYKKALTVKWDKNDPDSLPAFMTLLNIATVYRKRQQIDSSNIVSLEALAIARIRKDSLGAAILLYNIGDAYAAIKNPEKALPYIKESMELSKGIGDSEGVAFCNNSLGIIYQSLHEYKKSILNTDASIRQAKAMGMYEIEILADSTQYINYETLKNYRLALYYRNAQLSVKDSLASVEKDKEINSIRQNYEIEKKQQQIDLLSKENENNKLKRDITLYVAILVTTLLVSVFFAYRRINKLRKILEGQNKAMGAQNETLQEINETKNKLFSIIGHDLKGPFGSFKGLLELIQNNQVTEEESKLYLTKLYAGFTETFQLLDKLLIWANTQMKGMQINAVTFNCWQIVNQNIRLIAIRANEKKITIETNETKEPIHAVADMYTVDIVLRNLLENAVKFSNSAGLIKVLLTKEGAFVKIAVEDNGQGMDVNTQAKLFNKLNFHTTRGTAGEKGSGLGLHITKELVEKNGGAIWFESALGSGTTFYFTLPAA